MFRFRAEQERPKAVTLLPTAEKQEPYAVVPHVRICAGGGRYLPFLARPEQRGKRSVSRRECSRKDLSARLRYGVFGTEMQRDSDEYRVIMSYSCRPLLIQGRADLLRGGGSVIFQANFRSPQCQPPREAH
ncbi:protein of unknown function [Pseudomonas sp. JV551A1]|uniref:Uncharacterized protein n=1 Tax=Pseudomonas inefficax TaxID=2078786 RepID=A0AAQ1PBG1_9PSED|nr:protein of unknown function [Pseudomonas sp. JV551A1]SPO62028.1 protein of unknown function [Pseudomonas inefficax]